MRLWVTVVLAAAALVGCGEDARTLTREDVSGIPAGDAIGTQFSGEYLIVSNKVAACTCRVGSCATVSGLTGITTQVVQTDGALQMIVSTSPAVAYGGVTAEGQFTAGSVVEEVGNVQYALATGRFTLSGGTPSRMTGVQEATFTVPAFDCDVRSNFMSTYVGPPTTALAATVGPAPSLGRAGRALGLIGFAAGANR